MTKIQPVKFHGIDDFLDFLPAGEREIVEYLRRLVLDTIPQSREKLAYNVPFYYRHARICYIWPSAVPWGQVKKNGVQLGFINGYLLRDESGYLEKGNRKQVYVKTYWSLTDIEPELIRAYLFEAIEVDRDLKRIVPPRD